MYAEPRLNLEEQTLLTKLRRATEICDTCDIPTIFLRSPP
jgi:hypothetical protein